MRRAAVLIVLILGLARPAGALTIRDVIELSRAGLGEEVLLALVEVHRAVYAIDPQTLVALKEAGVSERVIVALVRSGREPQPPPPPPAPMADPEPATPQVVVIEHHAPPQVQEVVVPVPVYVTAPVHPGRRRARTVESTYVPFQFGPPASTPRVEENRRPVYWGFGGQLRPDAWTPRGHKEKPADAPRPTRPDSKP